MSKIAQKIAAEIFKHGYAYRLHPDNHSPMLWLDEVIDRALEGKIISKSEVDALRKDAENMQAAQYSYNYVEGLNRELRSQVVRLEQENTNLKLDVAALRMHPPIYYAMDWGFGKSWTGTTVPKNEVAAVKIESIPWWKFWTPNLVSHKL